MPVPVYSSRLCRRWKITKIFFAYANRGEAVVRETNPPITRFAGNSTRGIAMKVGRAKAQIDKGSNRFLCMAIYLRQKP